MTDNSKEFKDAIRAASLALLDHQEFIRPGFFCCTCHWKIKGSDIGAKAAATAWSEHRAEVALLAALPHLLLEEKNQEIKDLQGRIDRLRWAAIYRPGLHGGVCRMCGGKEDAHLMYCHHYKGPLVHQWKDFHRNGTFGGTDYFCMCGRSVRVGGMAGLDEELGEPLCPDADKEER